MYGRHGVASLGKVSRDLEGCVLVRQEPINVQMKER